MLAVLCGGLVDRPTLHRGGLGARRPLSGEEQQRFWAQERWQSSLQQLGAARRQAAEPGGGPRRRRGGLAESTVLPNPATTSKRWLRPRPPITPAEPSTETPT